jgi:pimeloyl-ACP methyl ester carboxylesterase
MPRDSRIDTVSGEVIHDVNGIELCAEPFGDRGDPAVLLIMGTAASMDWWEPELCERIAAGGRFVIRYDHRDTGRSVSYAPGEPGYTGRDLLDDAMGLLDALGVERAHLVGMSAGGGMAQLIALDHPERVSSLALISTTFADRSRPDLPGMSGEAAARFPVERPDWSDRDAVIAYIVEEQRALSSQSAPFEEDEWRGVAARMVDRTTNIESALTNHDLIASEDPPRRRLEEISIPTVVIHGQDDPLFPSEHGRALAETIPSAELVPLEYVGHELPRRAWNLVVEAILSNSSRATS